MARSGGERGPEIGAWHLFGWGGQLMVRTDHWAATREISGTILSDSTMWQSPAWSKAVTTVYKRGAHRLLNHRLLLALRLLRRRGRHPLVMTTGNQTALYYGLLCRLLFLDSRHVVTQLYLDERHGIVGLLHDPLMRWVLRHARGVIVPSSGEVDLVQRRFGVRPDRIRFLPYHTNVVEPQNVGCREGHVFAGGRNFRDYATFIEAVRGIDHEVVVVCGSEQLRDVDVPSNVRVYRDIPWEEYLALLRGAAICVVPLSSDLVPAGQVAILEAMGYGKPVITARAVGTIDYVREGINGMLYEIGDAAGLRDQIQRLLDATEFRVQLGETAYELVCQEFTFEEHVAQKLRHLTELGGLVKRGSDSM